MRTILITALAIGAMASAASAQIIAPDTTGQIHPSGSLVWPRDDSFAYLRAHGINRDDAANAAELNAPVADVAPVAATVPDYGYMPSSWEGNWEQWQGHQDACAVKFRSYDRNTDMYRDNTGRERFCQVDLMPLK